MSAGCPRPLSGADFVQGTDVIAAAFYRDPLFLYWCRRPEPAYARQSHAMGGILNGLQKPGSGHSLGTFAGEQLQGLAYLKDSVSLSSMAGVLPLLRQVVAACGVGTSLRFLRVGAELPRHWPQQRFLYLSTLAVLPRCQGRGHGRALLKAADDCARQNGYQLLCLDTQNPDNVGYYRSCGYRQRAHITIGKLESWCMVKEL